PVASTGSPKTGLAEPAVRPGLTRASGWRELRAPLMSSDLYEAIFRRRDVRAEFTGEPIPDDTLERILTAAHAAPSVGNSQPWDFVLVRDEQTRGQFQEHVRSERATFAATLDGERAETFSRIKVEGIMESTFGVVVTYDSE